MIVRASLVAAIAACSMVFHDIASAQDTAGDCRVGLYRLRDHSVVDIAPSEGSALRWRRQDGTSGELTEDGAGKWSSTLGWTKRSDGKRVSFSECAGGGITFDGMSGERIELLISETRFRSGNFELAGRLVMPPGRERVPVVVLVHGSERTSARDFYALQRLFPSFGVGVFVYDKRGTGASAGEYSQNYRVLADDAVAALREAKRLAGKRANRVGYQGSSQGGWVAPLAATSERVDFIVVAYGLAVSPAEEDREAIALDVTRRGYGADVLAKAMEVADATEAVLVSNFTAGYERVAAVRAKYQTEPWFAYVRGNVSFVILEMPESELRVKGPQLLPGIEPHYDPMPVLRKLDTPQLWILAEDDIDAPSAETARRLGALAKEGRPIAVKTFPHTEHGMFEYETRPDGSRVSTRNPAGYFEMMSRFILANPRTGARDR